MRAPKGLTIKLDREKDGRACFNIRATKFYLFKTMLKVARQHVRNPWTYFLIVIFAFYYLVRNGK